MKQHLLTVLLSVTTTAAIMSIAQAPPKPAPVKELVVDRLVVRRELIVSDTGSPWEAGFEEREIARGIYARTQAIGPAGLWVRGRLIKTEIDDPFDDRFHAIERDGSIRPMPGHISWNVWIDGAWRQLAIVQGEGLEDSESPRSQWTGGNHPGRLRFQSFRPNHPEPMTDATLGQGKMSIGGGGFGGGGLPYPAEVLEVWGGAVNEHAPAVPAVPRVIKDDGSGPREYALIGVGPQGRRTSVSQAVPAKGLATLVWDSATGVDAYIVVRDGVEITEPIRIEGSQKTWMDRGGEASNASK